MLRCYTGMRNLKGKANFQGPGYIVLLTTKCISQYRKEKRKRRLMDALSLDLGETEEVVGKLSHNMLLLIGLVLIDGGNVNSGDREILVPRIRRRAGIFRRLADFMHMA